MFKLNLNRINFTILIEPETILDTVLPPLLEIALQVQTLPESLHATIHPPLSTNNIVFWKTPVPK